MRDGCLDRYEVLKNVPLDPYHYTVSLLQQAEQHGLLEAQLINDIRRQFTFLLKEMITRYSQGKSSSLRIETGERLMLSVLYCMDAYTGSLSGPGEALETISSRSIEDIYRSGRDISKKQLDECAQLHRKICSELLDIDIIAYQTTINEGIQDFLDNYDIDFAAHDIPGSIDYPLLFDDMKVQGVFYIWRYLKHLELENSFCRLFAIKDIQRLLFNYGQVYQIDCKEALINIFEIVLTNAQFSVLLGKGAAELHITPFHYEHIIRELKDLDREEFKFRLRQAADRLLEELGIKGPLLREYILRFQDVILPRALAARDNDCLDNVVVLERYTDNTPDIIYDTGSSLDNDSFRLLLEEVGECTVPADRIQMIISRIQSLGDFIDILEADCLYDQDYQILFSRLGELELSMLAKIIFIEEIRAEGEHFSLLSSAVQYRFDREWQNQYCLFIQDLDFPWIKAIESRITTSMASR